MSNNQQIPFDDAIELLSNSYRREILRLITLKDRYAFELSKLLEISQRAVSNHLSILKEAGLVESEKRKSSKGPDREYFKLSRSVVLSLTLAPNLFLATLRNLDENGSTSRFATITPELQLGSPKKTTSSDVIREGLELLPQIREGLELLETQQSKLLRGYQGLRNHIREVLEREKFTTSEIRVLLLLIEHDGEMTQNDLSNALNVPLLNVTDLLNPLVQRDIINVEYFTNAKGNSTFRITIVSG